SPEAFERGASSDRCRSARTIPSATADCLPTPWRHATYSRLPVRVTAPATRVRLARAVWSLPRDRWFDRPAHGREPVCAAASPPRAAAARQKHALAFSIRLLGP